MKQRESEAARERRSERAKKRDSEAARQRSSERAKKPESEKEGRVSEEGSNNAFQIMSGYSITTGQYYMGYWTALHDLLESTCEIMSGCSITR